MEKRNLHLQEFLKSYQILIILFGTRIVSNSHNIVRKPGINFLLYYIGHIAEKSVSEKYIKSKTKTF